MTEPLNRAGRGRMDKREVETALWSHGIMPIMLSQISAASAKQSSKC